MSAFRHDTPAKPRVARVPKARIEPWVYTDRSGLSSVGAALSARAFGLCRCGSWLCIRWESAAPVGSSINVWKQLTQGLRPGLCGSIALTGLSYAITTNQLLGYFDALALCFYQHKTYYVFLVNSKI